ncbi:MAG TPA: CBS domain-containing protein [Thermoguttaceae bacterium]|nr:CBS domain-containing protein [Thermoguttaceae bacterium]
MYTARQVMQRNVVSLLPTATVEQAIRLLRELGFSGAPVVDRNGTLVGIISEFALLEIVYDPSIRTAPVSRFMTRDVLTVNEDTALIDIATLFVRHRIRRVPVVRDGRLVGVVSRPDLLSHVLEAGEELEESLHGIRAGASAT